MDTQDTQATNILDVHLKNKTYFKFTSNILLGTKDIEGYKALQNGRLTFVKWKLLQIYPLYMVGYKGYNSIQKAMLGVNLKICAYLLPLIYGWLQLIIHPNIWL